jgi:hypothetical protein
MRNRSTRYRHEILRCAQDESGSESTKMRQLQTRMLTTDSCHPERSEGSHADRNWTNAASLRTDCSVTVMSRAPSAALGASSVAQTLFIASLAQ